MKYEYDCANCDTELTVERSITDPEPEYFCEKCGYRLRRVYTPPAIQFKGGGFYSTRG